MKKIVVLGTAIATIAAIGAIIVIKRVKKSDLEREQQVNVSPLDDLTDEMHKLWGNIKDLSHKIHCRNSESEELDWDDPCEDCINRSAGVQDCVCEKGIECCPFIDEGF